MRHFLLMSKTQHCHICKKESDLTLCNDCYVPLFTPIEKHVSFAFLKNIPDDVDNESLKDAVVLDYFKSSLVNAVISSFTQLRQLRLSHCNKLAKIELTDLPNLISLDAFDCKRLTSASFSNVPNLVALDLSFCPSLIKINGEFPKLEYFSISHTPISKLPSLPSVKFVDISSTKIIDISSLYSCQNLQRLVLLENRRVNIIEIGKLAQIPTFASLLVHCRVLDFNGCPAKHNLKNIYSNATAKNVENIDFSGTNISFCYSSQIEKPHLEFEKPICSGDWYESYRYLYGPYPSPPNDIKPTLTEQEITSITNIYPLPANIDSKQAANHIMGAIFGTAIGDCLGIYCEGNFSEMINILIDQPPEITWTHPITTMRGSNFHRGTFTDDTALMLMFIRSVVSTAIENVKNPPEKPKSDDDVSNIFNPNDSGSRIHHWISKGIDEHLDGSGIGKGQYTNDVVKKNGFDQDSIEISKNYWIDTGMVKAGNGGVMRTGACGCFLFWDEKKVIEISKQFCQCTHYNPFCTFSASLISLIIARLLQWRCGIRESFDLDETIDDVKGMFQANDDETENYEKIRDFSEINQFLYATDLEELCLNGGVPRTLSTMGCAIYVLRKNFTYEKGIEEIIRAGGDADTNGACAGAVLGAKWGFGEIPVHLLDYMWYGGMLYRDAVPFLKLMGLKFDPPSYEDLKQFRY